MSQDQIDSTNWYKFASCRGQNVSSYFPHSYGYSNRAQLLIPLSYCKYCPVSDYCLQEAVLSEADGIWGCTTPAQRDVYIANYLDGLPSNSTLSKCKKFISIVKGDNTVKPYARRINRKKRRYKSSFNSNQI